jgi:hypothetical protein
MSDLAVMLGPVAALLGVVLGGLLTSRSQMQRWQREEDHKEREAIRTACAGYVAAARRYAGYIKNVNARVTVVPGNTPDDARIHALDDPALLMDLETASASVLLAVRSSTTVTCARDVRRVLADLAVARADRPGTGLPDELLATLRAAEAAFINAARVELGVPALTHGLYRLE